MASRTAPTQHKMVIPHRPQEDFPEVGQNVTKTSPVETPVVTTLIHGYVTSKVAVRSRLILREFFAICHRGHGVIWLWEPRKGTITEIVRDHGKPAIPRWERVEFGEKIWHKSCINVQPTPETLINPNLTIPRWKA